MMRSRGREGRGFLVDMLISVDMEGVAGIATRQQIHPQGRDYPIARALMTAEANAAVAGAFDGGATSVVVNDSHGPMDNLLGEQLDQRADYVVGDPKPLDMMQEVTPQTGVVLFVGYHAGAAVAEKAFPGVITVPVKTALGRTAARSKHPAAAREAITAGAARAVASATARTIRPVPIPDELVIEAELRPNGAIEMAALVPGTGRTDARTVRYQAATPRTAVDVLIVWSALTSQYLNR